MGKLEREVRAHVEKDPMFQKGVVILEHLPCIHTTLEMCLISRKEAIRFLSRKVIASHTCTAEGENAQQVEVPPWLILTASHCCVGHSARV